MKRFLLLLLLLSTSATFGADVKQVIDSTAFVIEEGFLYPERGKEIGAALRGRTLDPKLEGEALAAALTKLVQSIEDDKHLYVRFDPATASTPFATRDELRARMQPMRRMRRGDTEERPAQLSSKLLDGNIGYLEVLEFERPSIAEPQITAAMQAIEGAKAVIIDLRKCRGGAQPTVDFLASYFFPLDDRVLLRSRMRGMPERESRVVETPSRKFERVPLYILISDKTFSAGEAFAYILQQFGRASLVGTKTKGGGRHNMRVDIGAGFTASVSIGEVEHPKSGTSWQSTGVVPDVAAEDALQEAVRRASKS
jgi:C-terminal processing protease CtpA/Prc